MVDELAQPAAPRLSLPTVLTDHDAVGRRERWAPRPPPCTWGRIGWQSASPRLDSFWDVIASTISANVPRRFLCGRRTPAPVPEFLTYHSLVPVARRILVVGIPITGDATDPFSGGRRVAPACRYRHCLTRPSKRTGRPPPERSGAPSFAGLVVGLPHHQRSSAPVSRLLSQLASRPGADLGAARSPLPLTSASSHRVLASSCE